MSSVTFYVVGVCVYIVLCREFSLDLSDASLMIGLINHFNSLQDCLWFKLWKWQVYFLYLVSKLGQSFVIYQLIIVFNPKPGREFNMNCCWKRLVALRCKTFRASNCCFCAVVFFFFLFNFQIWFVQQKMLNGPHCYQMWISVSFYWSDSFVKSGLNFRARFKLDWGPNLCFTWVSVPLSNLWSTSAM